MPCDWDALVAFALTLPGVELGSSYGTPALKLRKKLLVRLREEGDVIVLRAALDEIDLLIDQEPEIFYQTDHYRGWPAVLVRLAAIDCDRLCARIERAWDAGATARQRAARG